MFVHITFKRLQVYTVGGAGNKAGIPISSSPMEETVRIEGFPTSRKLNSETIRFPCLSAKYGGMYVEVAQVL